MATSLKTNLHQPSLCCGTKLYFGLKLQSACLRPNLSADFYGRVNKSLQRGTRNCKPTRSRVRMMSIGTPKVPYSLPGEGTGQWVDIWNVIYQQRIIFIGRRIDEEFGNQILAIMLYLDIIDDNKRLYFYINGPGGDFSPSLAIYDTMQSLKSPVGTHCVGCAYSLAGFLLAAGDKGYRFANPLSRIALQSPAGAARGEVDDILNEANKLLITELAKNTGQSVEKINKDLSRVKLFSAQEALEYGLIDRIASPTHFKADAPHKDAGTGLVVSQKVLYLNALKLMILMTFSERANFINVQAILCEDSVSNT
ncbi:ATP-dependent Clp protease proteolytic subunit-related protein 2, chloroplastic-like isoform X2 [Durio zibethinus]|uniref:ATP-dependent Clp protease proteolytic subunit n=1 Tax=Durio zibethinus TaxID=66656 RepID=A0A6P6A3H6_DURZI|nr:ATP-dependent Clp protease proteolytic subunit-related protein 2, chloroplastic-like isoform X2 [Durio zibethinus]